MTALHNILFLDIETVSQYASHSELPQEWQELWRRKADFLIKDKLVDTAETVYGKSALYPEFGKIICISCGIISGTGEGKKMSIKSFFNDDEKDILIGFSELLERWATDHHKWLCAHNGKEFDFPWLCRRMVINQLPVPAILDIRGKRPWEVPHLDTMDLWKFGDYKTYTGLNLLAHVLGILTPKDDIDGSLVGVVYWRDHDLQRIVNYCQKDVVTTAQVYLRIQGLMTIPESRIMVK